MVALDAHTIGIIVCTAAFILVLRCLLASAGAQGSVVQARPTRGRRGVL